MLKMRWVPTLMVLGLLIGVPGYAEMSATSLQRMISQNDHAGLESYYAQQARELREKAKQWEFTVEYYEKHPEPQVKTESAQHAAHCLAIAQGLKKAADEAAALAKEHGQQRQHG